MFGYSWLKWNDPIELMDHPSNNKWTYDHTNHLMEIDLITIITLASFNDI